MSSISYTIVDNRAATFMVTTLCQEVKRVSTINKKLMGILLVSETLLILQWKKNHELKQKLDAFENQKKITERKTK